MIISAIIAEYNPFHNGHLLHIQETIKNTKCDYLIVVLSGSITQRGTPSIISKWDRAKAAVLAGADLVIELPAPFSLASAQNFSFAAVSLLESLKIVDFLSFGSESGDIDELAKVATVSDSFEVYEQTFENLKSGISYSVAKQISIAAAKNCDENILTSSNNILAVEYLIALNRLGSKITPYTYKRDTVNHNDLTPNGDFASATAIRKMIFESKPFEKYLPSYSFEMIQNANIASLDFIDFGIMPLLRSYSISSFKDVPEISEGLDHRILKNLYLSTSFSSFLEAASTRRYTKSRIRRAIFYSILKVKNTDMKITPSYARILAASKKGPALINLIKKASDIPIITKPKSATELLSKEQLNTFEIESRATDFCGLCKKTPVPGGENLTKSPFIEK